MIFLQKFPVPLDDASPRGDVSRKMRGGAFLGMTAGNPGGCGGNDGDP
jgi:hypothetical protein